MGKIMLLSIIMPVYNAEKYLSKTLENVVQQLVDDYELILVNDGSSDKSGSICDSWASKNNHIKVIHQANRGIGGARNAGLEIAKGKYIGFVDNDDFIHPQIFQIMVSIGEKEQADVVFSNTQNISDGIIPQFDSIDIEQIKYSVIDKQSAYDGLFGNSAVDGRYISIYNKLYRREKVKECRFPQSGIEDAVFNCLVFNVVDKIVILDEKIKLYNWVQRANSTWHNPNSAYHLNTLVSYFEMCDYLEREAPDYWYFAGVKTMKKVLSARYNYRNSPLKEKILRIIKDKFKGFYRHFVWCKEIKIYDKVLLSALYFCPGVYAAFRYLTK